MATILGNVASNIIENITGDSTTNPELNGDVYSDIIVKTSSGTSAFDQQTSCDSEILINNNTQIQTKYYMMVATCSTSPTGYVTWIATNTPSDIGKPSCAGTLGPTQIASTWYTPGIQGGSVSSSFTPAQLNLTGYWRSNYSGSPWTPTTSAGTSATNGNLAQGSTPLTVGTAVNGLTPAHGNGTSLFLTSDNNASTYISTGVSSGFALVNLTSISANTTILATLGTNRYVIYCDTTSTITFLRFASSTNVTISTPITTGYNLICWYTDGTNQKIKVNSNSWASVAQNGSIDSLAYKLDVFRSTSETVFTNGNIFELGLSSSNISESTFDNIRQYCNTTYGLSL